MYYEFERTLEPLWFKSLGHALEHAHQTGKRLVRELSNSYTK